MSIKYNFARNLRMLCQERGNANIVCRDLKLNRQQFQRYLNEETLPSSATMKKLSDYFNIPESMFYSAEMDGKSVRWPARAASRHVPKHFIDVVRPLFDGPPPSIKPGVYFLWITAASQPDKVVCAPIFLELQSGALTFRRVTGSAEPKDRIWWHRVGDHMGLVIQRLDWLLLLGVNQRGNQEPSLIRLRSVPLSTVVYGGHATIYTAEGPSFGAVCMRPAPASMTYRKALRYSRSYSVGDEVIDAITRMVLDKQKQELLAMVHTQLGA